MLAILTTHPIQYQVPLWKALAQEGKVPFEVWYLSNHGTQASYDTEFKHTFAWDLDMLSGYQYRFLSVNENASVNQFWKLRIEESLTHLFRENQVKALWIQGWQVFAYWQSVWSAYQNGIPVWLRAETNDLHRSHWAKQIPRRLLLCELFRRMSYFFYIGTANHRFYQNFGVPAAKLVSAPYCVDNQRFMQAAQQVSKERKTLRQNWSIAEGSVCLLFCGKFIPKKRPGDIFSAIARLLDLDSSNKVKPRLHVLMVGDGELRTTLEEKATQLNMRFGRQVVTFAGFLNQTEIINAYVAADYLILPSDAGETWGLVVNEALACGRPAIVSHLCGCAEDLARPLGDEFVYECGNVTNLAQNLQKIMSSTLIPSQAVCQALVEQHNISNTIQAVIHTSKDLFAF